MALLETPKAYKNRMTYPNKFLDLSSTYFPVDIKELISLCRLFYYSSPIIRNIVSKMSEYPISDLIMKVEENADKTKDVENIYNDLLYTHLKIRTVLLEAGLNYMVSGNNIISINQDFKRSFICSNCGATTDGMKFKEFKVRQVPISSTKKKIQILGHCPRCGVQAPLEIKDTPITDLTAVNIIFWNPLEVSVEYNEWTGKKRFLYTIPKKTRNRLLTALGSKDRDFVLTIPALYIEAIEEEQAIELDAYHFGTPELAQDKRGLNVPVIVSVLKDYWYYISARRAQEAIFAEHAVPFRSIFPQSVPGMDPFTMMRLDKWKGAVKEQIELWKKDPNHIMVTPVPVGSTSVGGDARYLLLTNELRFVEESIINGFGAPIELIKGGVSWSGTAISLRVLENHFLSFRKDLELLLNTFILPKVAKILKIPLATVRFSRLRMGDDQQFKQMLFQLVQSGFFSLQTFLNELGFDAANEKETVLKEAQWFNSLKNIQGEGAAKSQSMQQIILARGTVKAQEASMQETAYVRYKQQAAAAQGSVGSDIPSLANQFLNLATEEERRQFLLQLQVQPNGKERSTQLAEYLKVYSTQEPPEEKIKTPEEGTGKVEVPPAGKSRKIAETEDRVRASKVTHK